jgi:GNAT superfamily N-acetyltransferase
VESARWAVADDQPRLVELGALARAELGAQERGGRVFVNREAAAFDPAVTVVGEIDGVAVGYGTARTEALADGSRLGVVEDLFVEEGARSVGVAEAMIGLLLDWCREAGCAGVDAYALPGMRATKNFFETFGFTARLLVVHHRLEGRAETSSSGADDPA